jgi:hypothetical protein
VSATADSSKHGHGHGHGHKKSPPRGDGLIPKEAASKLFMAFAVIAVIGLGLAGLGWATDPERFAFSYLTGFVYVWTICMGGLFFTIIHHLTRASWSVGPRRVMEWLSQGLLPCLVLFLPILALGKTLYPWLDPANAHDHLIHEKAGYLNQTFFLIRCGVYFLIWIGFATFFYRNSRAQDASGDRALSEKMQGAAAPATALFALSISFAGFDWMMSLDPHWYSTMWGVYTFAGALIGSHAVLSLATRKINVEGWGGDLVTTEHQHDVGKYTFAWVVFWAYIGFSQFMLIWYANIPEETVFYRHRWEHGWHVVSLALFIGHFILPFLILISRHAKRGSALVLGAVLLFVMHYVDVYWMIMPAMAWPEGTHFVPSWIDLGGLLAPLGVVGAFVARKASTDPVVPLRDPYVAEAMKAENLV